MDEHENAPAVKFAKEHAGDLITQRMLVCSPAKLHAMSGGSKEVYIAAMFAAGYLQRTP